MNKCKTCRYASLDHATHCQTTICNYLIITGTPRGCPVGEKCDKWEKWSHKLKRRKRNETD